ncbi:hypothetical protein [Mesoterricola silvestris]|uniref:Uncharacterized protein n=1 Tax=Mesoterricola silvestris TaxID=2927979 RepID=A0AA48KBB4_9BACT|nr:hypothetical protein [Mesoterricola silvestris]BDU72353.1 hypothetical protein METEAL_15270 [Mesoterricola silvestris]
MNVLADNFPLVVVILAWFGLMGWFSHDPKPKERRFPHLTRKGK